MNKRIRKKIDKRKRYKPDFDIRTWKSGPGRIRLTDEEYIWAKQMLAVETYDPTKEI